MAAVAILAVADEAGALASLRCRDKKYESCLPFCFMHDLLYGCPSGKMGVGADPAARMRASVIIWATHESGKSEVWSIRILQTLRPQIDEHEHNACQISATIPSPVSELARTDKARPVQPKVRCDDQMLLDHDNLCYLPTFVFAPSPL